MLDQMALYFYDPLIFWGVPLVIAVAGVGLRRALNWLTRRRGR
jgi:hypothetical protein